MGLFAPLPHLSLHPQGAGGHQRLAAEHAGVVHQIPSGDIVWTIRHNVIHEVGEVKASSRTESRVRIPPTERLKCRSRHRSCATVSWRAGVMDGGEVEDTVGWVAGRSPARAAGGRGDTPPSSSTCSHKRHVRKYEFNKWTIVAVDIQRARWPQWAHCEVVSLK